MKREAIQELEQWKGRADRKPLLLFGARQVGKTWLMQEFGRASYRNTAYVRFDTKPQIREMFEQGADIPRLLAAIQYEVGFRPEPGETLIVFDEIQECPAALTSLKYFCEEAAEYHVMAAGSQLGIRSTWGSGFPVGKVDFMRLYPMCFTEFLEATGYARLTELLHSGDMGMVTAFRADLEDQLRRYYYVGGMPEAVRKYAETGISPWPARSMSACWRAMRWISASTYPRNCLRACNCCGNPYRGSWRGRTRNSSAPPWGGTCGCAS